MTIKQYLAHLRYWLLNFPKWNDHITVGEAGGNRFVCLVCDFVEYETEDVRLDKNTLDTGGGCSICGTSPAVNVHDSYWMCGDCIFDG